MFGMHVLAKAFLIGTVLAAIYYYFQKNDPVDRPDDGALNTSIDNYAETPMQLYNINNNTNTTTNTTTNNTTNNNTNNNNKYADLIPKSNVASMRRPYAYRLYSKCLDQFIVDYEYLMSTKMLTSTRDDRASRGVKSKIDDMFSLRAEMIHLISQSEFDYPKRKRRIEKFIGYVNTRTWSMYEEVVRRWSGVFPSISIVNVMTLE
jgi:hypothetical protein